MTRVFVVPLSPGLASRLTGLTLAGVACLALAGCSKPEPPEKDRPPEPTAASTATATASGRPVEKHDDLRRWMQTPIEKAKTAEATVLDAAKAQRAEIDAQMQGDSTQEDSSSETPPPAY